MDFLTLIYMVLMFWVRPPDWYPIISPDPDYCLQRYQESLDIINNNVNWLTPAQVEALLDTANKEYEACMAEVNQAPPPAHTPPGPGYRPIWVDP